MRFQRFIRRANAVQRIASHHTVVSKERRANRPCDEPLRATEKSTPWFPEGRGDTLHRPCPAAARPEVRRGLPRPPSRDPGVDSSAPQSVGRAAEGSANGPRNDNPYHATESRGWRIAPPERHFEGAPRKPSLRRTRRATEESTPWFPEARGDTLHWPCPAAARPQVRRGLPRPPSRDPGVDSSAPQSVGRAADGSAHGPRNDNPCHATESRGWRIAPPERHFEGAPRKTVLATNPCARRRNLFPGSPRPAATPCTGPVRRRRDRRSVAGCRVHPRAIRE
jgi:hypothetical protein